MTDLKTAIEKYGELEAEKWAYDNIYDYTAGFHSAIELLWPVIEALQFECGNRCADQNPCNAKETLNALLEILENK